MTASKLGMPPKNSAPSRKRALVLPIIAPKDDRTTSNPSFDPSMTEQIPLPRPRSRFPPRSRTGCCKSASSDFATDDLLPPFSLLTSDEERERRAETSRPGTYHVIVIPESFTHLPEYIENASEEGLGDTVSSPLSGSTETDQFANDPELEDSNTVILKQFKDTKRSSSSQYLSPSRSPTSDLRESSLSAATATSQNAADDDPVLDMLEQESLDAILLGHFRDVVWMQLVPAGGIFNFAGGSLLDTDVFDREATNFPPLAAAELDGSSLWSHHISRLLHISALRRSTFGSEPYPHLVWWICSVDLYALLSGAGTGAFVQEAMANPDLFPGLGAFQQPTHIESYRSVSLEDGNSSIVLGLYHDTFKLAARLGFLAAESRRINLPFPCSHQDQRQRDVCEWREALWQLWNSPEAQFLARAQGSLPLFLQEILWQSSLLYHTSLLVSYTSLWPGQRFGPGAAPQEEVRHHAAAVFSVAESVMAQSKANGWRSVTFPVFLAGSVTPSSDLKVMALEMLSRLEAQEIGRNATTIRYLLQVVYERQMQQSRGVGHPGSADWIEVLAEHGLPLVTFG
ncbi:uncharacterized protein CDV56_107867 [Aspergillus thermomutatus]|uniref:Transcription factor domain-containing protein n=1 Tax=Aspergillus thermomutatus TaxID=41047 RepID=A0A397HQD1_ASPTH|nr:uncharacterized protein CDV56_107867 [Aspergillus thermomutatus]RHZ62670.1 hypothetical protein CDV56_107867 [Aspergillus thermomutatus]